VQCSATMKVIDAVPPSAAPLIAVCDVIASFPVLLQVVPPVDVPVDVPVLVPVEVPVDVPVVVPVEVVVPVDVPVVVVVDVPVVVPVDVPVEVPVLVDVPVDVPVEVPVLVDVPVDVPVDVFEDPPELPEVPPVWQSTLKTFCLSPPGAVGFVCFTESLYWPSGKGCGVGHASNCQSLLWSPRAVAFHVPSRCVAVSGPPFITSMCQVPLEFASKLNP
jgi:hypothetical protein